MNTLSLTPVTIKTYKLPGYALTYKSAKEKDVEEDSIMFFLS